MSMLMRILRGGRSKAYAEGVALLEEGRYAEASEILRPVAMDDSDLPATSLAGFHFRQALVQEGRRHLRAERWAKAVPWFAEAVDMWHQYPDLHCLHGAALGLAGRWSEALPEAKAALRLNPDYAEARLLEALALLSAERSREAADSLQALVESGRRIEHWLVTHYAEAGPFKPDALPADLRENLVHALAGRSEKEELAAAVALCRAGRWQDGLDRFAALVEKQPRYPDYRTRLAAALFQVGRNDEALAEVEAALALNEDYRTAQDLKGLVLADTGRIGEARGFLAQADARRAGDARGREGGSHEQLFGAYLRGVLALLHGDHGAVAGALDGWGDLVRQFARAELLLAAADDLAGRRDACGRRLASLADEWPGEPLYAFLGGCHLLRERRSRDLGAVLARWPGRGAQPDLRPLFLQTLLDLSQGRRPDSGAQPPETAAPAAAAEGDGTLTPAGEPVVAGDAWRLTGARAALVADAPELCWEQCCDLVGDGPATEPVWDLLLAAGLAGAPVPEDWTPPPVEPAASLPAVLHLAVRRGAGGEADAQAARWRRLHPEHLPVWWLSARFWLAPVRGWLA
jgi:tetratricopeptide (TPR) repeat protein